MLTFPTAVRVRNPRFRIQSVMAAVAVVALVLGLAVNGPESLRG